VLREIDCWLKICDYFLVFLTHMWRVFTSLSTDLWGRSAIENGLFFGWFPHLFLALRRYSTKTTATYDNTFYTSHASYQMQFGRSRCGICWSSRGTTVKNICATVFCFNLVQQTIVGTLLLLPCNSQIKS